MVSCVRFKSVGRVDASEQIAHPLGREEGTETGRFWLTSMAHTLECSARIEVKSGGWMAQRRAPVVGREREGPTRAARSSRPEGREALVSEGVVTARAR